MVTIKDVARQAGVSVCTVSRAISGKGYIKKETYDKIMQTVKELNYTPSRVAVSLKTGHTNLLALIVPSIRNVYYPKLARFVQNYAYEKGYMMILCSTDYSLEKEKQFIKSLCSQNVSGEMISTCSNENAHIKELGNYNIPYVYLNRAYEDDIESCMLIDNREAADKAVSYLIEKGHTNIGGLFRTFNNMSYAERLMGMTDAMKRNNIVVNESNILLNLVDPEDSYNEIEALLNKEDRPEAIFASDDMMAYAVYKVAYELKLNIPGDVSIVGFDNSMMADVITPHLTTFETPAKELAKLAIDYIDTYLKTGERIETPVLKGRLIIRESVADKSRENT